MRPKMQNRNNKKQPKKNKHRNIKSKSGIPQQSESDDQEEDVSEEGDLDAEDDELESEDNEHSSEDDETSVSEFDDEVENNEKSKKIKKSGKFSEEAQHKKSLLKLKETDPDFYKFLQKNDKNLLRFEASDSESEGEEDDDEKVHKPPDHLEVASDESDVETEGTVKEIREGSVGNVVTAKMVESWREGLKAQKPISVIAEVVKAFHAAVQQAANEEDPEPCKYRVKGTTMFNSVVRLCIVDLQEAMRKLLKIPQKAREFDPTKSKKWVKVQSFIKCYLTDLLKLMSVVASSDILSVLLKHLHQMVSFCGSFLRLRRHLINKLVELWSTDEETVRILSFLCLVRLTCARKELLDLVLKKMYMGYVKNSKFVSPNVLPSINFMRRSLVEIYSLDAAVSYKLVFLYIRQLAIHLRNAIVVQKKSSTEAVFNWQYTLSMQFWSDLLGAMYNKPQMKSLLYPLVQIIIGVIQLRSAAQYFPMRFHCVKMLIDLSVKTGVFIPVMPFLLEILTAFNFNKKSPRLSLKPLNINCVLRLSRAQLEEKAFKDAVIDKIHELLIEAATAQAHFVSFPDSVVPALIQLKTFLKNCKVPNYSKKMKQVVDKIEENGKFIESERKKATFQLHDTGAIEAWETNMKVKGTPLEIFYKKWSKLHREQVEKKMIDSLKLDDYNFPSVKRVMRNLDSSEPGEVELFPSDDENDNDFFKDLEKVTEETPTKRKQIDDDEQKSPKRKKKAASKKEEEGDIPDRVEDISLADFE